MTVKDPTYILNQTDPEAGQTEPALRTCSRSFEE